MVERFKTLPEPRRKVMDEFLREVSAVKKKECESIRPGMTRAELSKVFSTEGGISTVTHRTYVYRDCPYIKVDVDFAPSAPKQDVEKPTEIVTKISKPYLEWSIID